MSQPAAPPPAAPPPSRFGEPLSEWWGLAIAALVFVVVLIVCYMCVRVYKAYTFHRPRCPGEGFLGWSQYRPSCSGQWMSDRRGACKGLTTGDMPSIEDDIHISWEPCGGTLGVPPPVYQ